MCLAFAPTPARHQVVRKGAGGNGPPLAPSPARPEAHRGEVPPSPPVGFQIPTVLDPSLAPEGKHAASAYAFYFPITGTREEQHRLAEVMADRVVARIAHMAPNFPDIIERRVVYPSYAY